MRTSAAALAATLVLTAAACPSTPVPESEVLVAATSLLHDVAEYSSRHPEAPGSLGEWASGALVPGQPLLIHSYPALEPYSYHVPLESTRGGAGGFVTLNADDGRWQAYGRRATAFPAVTREDAADEARRKLGSPVEPATLRAVSMPDKRLYWHWCSPEEDRELFISMSDASDIHTGADEELFPLRPDVMFRQEDALRADAEVPREDARPAHAQTREDAPAIAGTDAAHLGAAARGNYPDAFDLQEVPFYYQLTDSSCGAATDQMVLDYWGPAISQEDIAAVANTNSSGTRTSDMMRAAHFSAISTAIQDPDLHGYSERRLGYGALECNWLLPDESDPDFPDRHHDLKRLISSGYPLIIVTKYDSNSFGSHARVLKGYDDNTGVYIVHDPWYTGVYQGPDVHFEQGFLVDELWTASRMWATLFAPWEVTVDAPAEVLRGTSFTVTAHVVYTGPHPFGAQDEAYSPAVTLLPSGLCTPAPEESATRKLYGWFSDSGCLYDAVTWELVADTLTQTGALEFLARGLVHDSASSYVSYSDSIGGRCQVALSIVDASRVTVDAGGSGHFTNIQNALDFAARGDTVDVLPGTYSGPDNRDLSFHAGNVRLRGVGGAEATVIDCEGAGRGFALTEGEGRGALIEGFTVVNGAAPGTEWTEAGGGIFLDGASPTVRNVLFKSNTSPGHAGGVCCLNGASPIFERCVFWKNEAEQCGGAVACADGSPAEFVNCTLALNSAPEGGGVFCRASSPLLTDTIIYGCLDGAAITCEEAAAPSMTSCCVYGNTGGDALPGSCSAVRVLSADPLLCDAARGALQLQECSPCIGSGVSGGDIGACPPRCACADIEPFETSFFFHPPRPSPFVGSTALVLDVPADAGHVTLAIYNILGQRVRMLIDGNVPSGRRRLEWNGEDSEGRPVSAGVYLARCECRAGTSMRKLVLMR